MSRTYLRPAQVAARYSVHRSTVWRWAKDPKNPFPPFEKRGPNVSAIREDALDQHDDAYDALRDAEAVA